MKIRQDIKMLHDVQQLIGSLQWLHNTILIPPELLTVVDIDLPPRIIDRLQAGPTIFTNASSLTSTAEAAWQSGEQLQCVKTNDPTLSVQQLEAAAVVLACGLFPEEHLNIVTDLIFVAKLCLAMSGPGVSVSTVAMMLEEALYSRKGTISVIHINSHDLIKGFYQIGNEKADAAAKVVWTLRDAHQLHESLHIGAKALAKKCGISTADAKHVVATCPHCQKSPLWSSGVKPRGLKASEIWQTDFTQCQLLRSRAWLAVTVDTYSGMIVATQHLKTDSKATIQHWLTAIACFGVPKQIKTDNGPNFISKMVQAFISKWNIILVHGIPYNSTGQAIVERANQTLKTKQEILAKTEGFTNTIPPSDQDWIIRRPRNSYAPLPEEREKPSSSLAPPKKPTPSKSKQQQYLCMILFLGFIGRGQADTGHYPHQPFRWVLHHLSGERVIKEIITPNSPSFEFKLRDIFPLQLGFPKIGEVTLFQTYWCPASNPGKNYCNYPGYGYCEYWGCEAIVTSNRWRLQQPDKFLQIWYAPHSCCEPRFHMDRFMTLLQDGRWHTCTGYTMTIQQPTHDSWATGKVWTTFAHITRSIWVNVQIIRFPPPISQSVGPNPVLAVGGPRKEIAANGSSNHKTQMLKSTRSPSGLLAKPTPFNPFLSVLNATFLSLNQSNLNLMESCWLCYDAQLSFYKGVAFNLPFIFSKSENPRQCRWDTPRRGITLSQITGQGKCFGSATLAKQMGNVCQEFIQLKGGKFQWVIPAASGMWVCQRSRVSPCVLLDKFDNSADFCVQVLIVPRDLYHQEEEVYRLFEEPDWLHKREVITGITIAMLLGLVATGTATGISALATQHQGLSQLQMTINEDLQRIEKSISSLEESLSSLSEIVLQNRRGPDLLFMQQGGLCAALREECCFYADHTGVIRDSMAELIDRLNLRKMDREAQQGWFESWFNWSPWLTTLVSTLIGPLTIILLTLIFGPCILNKLVLFVKKRLEAVNIMFVERQQLL
ncbi:endogenous retrovirus group K member 18 Pol protein-like protein [Turdus rufiventris]|nr:endogenous retrovirus group K member 18 Pol protein-like protein [Turdus rufiventris]